MEARIGSRANPTPRHVGECTIHYTFHPLPVRFKLNGWRSVWYVKLTQHEGLILDFYVYSIFYKVREFLIQNWWAKIREFTPILLMNDKSFMHIRSVSYVVFQMIFLKRESIPLEIRTTVLHWPLGVWFRRCNRLSLNMWFPWARHSGYS